MAKKGPPPRPTHMKIVEGCREDRINRLEPEPGEGAVVPPMRLSAKALSVWNRLAPDLIAKKVLTHWDVDQFAILCNAIATYQECAALMGDEYLVRNSSGNPARSPYWQMMRDNAQIMTSTGARFGLTPSDRAQLKIDPGSHDSGGADRLLS